MVFEIGEKSWCGKRDSNVVVIKNRGPGCLRRSQFQLSKWTANGIDRYAISAERSPEIRSDSIQKKPSALAALGMSRSWHRQRVTYL